MRATPRTRALSIVLSSVALTVSLVHAQSSAGPRPVSGVAPVDQIPQPVGTSGTAGKPATTFRAGTELVALNVTVTDGRDHFVKGLSKGDFAVLEDGVLQDVAFFMAANIPLDVAVMIDTSASMSDTIGLVREAALRFVQTLREGDRAEIIGFSEQASVLAPFTGDKLQLDAAIKASATHGSTALYTSLYVALKDLQRLAKQEGEVRRPAIVVLTDGDDTASLLSFDDLLDAAQRSNVAVYAISIVSPFDEKRFDGDKRFSTESDFALRTLARDTGGQAFFPLALSDLNGVYQRIADELGSQYALGYSPHVAADGSFHRLFVRVLNHDDARPRTRTGYYTSRPDRASLEGSR